MLILSRTEGQRIMIHVPGLDEPIVIEAVNLKHGYARIGIDAPREVRILREEVAARQPA